MSTLLRGIVHTVVITIAGLVMVGAILFGAGAIVSNPHLYKPHTSASPTPIVTVKHHQPPSAEAIFARLGCKNFKDLGPAADGMVLDSGTCYIHGTKYAIDTFATKAARLAWLKMATGLGVQPKWETHRAVVYVSVAA